MKRYIKLFIIVFFTTAFFVGSVNKANAGTINSEGFESSTGSWVADAGTCTWTRDSGGTPSSSTGPNTGNNASTWYMFVETSSSVCGTSDIAYLTYGPFDATAYGANSIEISFYYHMYGADMGTLSVEAYNGSTWQSAWSISGQQQGSNGAAYTQATVDLTAYKNANMQIRFKYDQSPLTGFTGDAAIDDVVISDSAPPVKHIITTAFRHSCAVISDGTVRCWGENAYGQLGNGTTTDSTSPVQVSGISNAVEVVNGGDSSLNTGGTSYSCALLSDGTIKCWGRNSFGAMGNGTSGNYYTTPVSVSGISTATKIAGGGGHVCALLSDGTIKCWGYGSWGQMGDGGTSQTNTTPHTVSGISNAVDIGGEGSTHSCAALSDGTAKCWGGNWNGQIGDGTATQRTTPVAVSGLSGVRAIAAGGSWTTGHTCAALSGGTVKCWGYNGVGQLGDGTTTQSLTPVTVSGISTAIDQVSAGNYRSCVVLSDGTAKCWGSAALGDGTWNTSYTPVTVSGLSSTNTIEAGDQTTCAFVSNSTTAKCWGNDSYGTVGDGTTSQRATPVGVIGIPPTAPIVTTDVASSITTSGATLNGTGNGSGATATGWFRYSTTNSTNLCNDTFGTRAPASGGTNLGLGGSVSYSASISGLSSATPYYYCAVVENSVGKSGGSVTSFTTAGAPSVTTNSESSNTTLGVVLNGSANPNWIATTGWFRYSTTNDAGLCNDTFGTRVPATGGTDLGSGNSSQTYWEEVSLSSATPYYYCAIAENSSGKSGGSVVSFTTSSTSKSADKISVGSSHACAVLSDGTVNCWGYNAYGQLGDGTTTNRTTPVAVSGISNATDIFTGVYHTCAVLSDNTAKCWGYNAYGQLGDGTTTQRTTPVAVSGLSTATKIGGGAYHTCAVLSDNTMKCWGYNPYGNLGDGTTTQRTTPVAVSGISTATDVAKGLLYHTCALLSNGSVNCWGYNAHGELGDGTTTQRTTPVAVSGISTATNITLGYYHSCALLSNGTVNCWGYNNFGQLGDGTTTQRTTPVAVSGISTATDVGADIYHSCAVLSDGTANCWGYNVYGQLGDGTTTNRTTPVSVSGLSSASDIEGGGYETCSLLSSGGIKCWGYNNYGQLGDGSVVSRYTPVYVTNFAGLTVPTITTDAASSVTQTTATLNGTANPNGFATTGWFRYFTSNPGTCADSGGTRVPASSGTALGSGSVGVAYSQGVTGLTPGTTYYVCAIASNTNGTGVGSVQSFSTLTGAPTSVTTNQESGLGSYYVTLNGSANPNNYASYGFFRVYASNPGSCTNSGGTRYPTDPGGADDISLGSGSTGQAFAHQAVGKIDVTDIDPGTPYWYCAFARNAYDSGVGASAVDSFTTPAGATDPCDQPLGGNHAIAISCSYFGSIGGVDAGTGTSNTGVLTINTSKKLTLNAAQQVAWGSISLQTGSSINIGTGGILRRAPVWLVDADGDGFINAADQYIGTTPPAGGVRRNTVTANYAYYSNLSTSPALDCNDSNQYVYRTETSLVTDADNDGYKTSAAASNPCVGDASTINGRTYYKDASNASSWLPDAQKLSATTDCYDTSAAPCPPTSVSASAASATQMNVSWSAATGPTATSYNLEWCSGTSCTPSTTISGVISTYSHTGRSCGTVYGYRVIAVNASGSSTASSTSYATTSGCNGTLTIKTVVEGSGSDDSYTVYIDPNPTVYPYSYTETVIYSTPFSKSLLAGSWDTLPTTFNGAEYRGWALATGGVCPGSLTTGPDWATVNISTGEETTLCYYVRRKATINTTKIVSGTVPGTDWTFNIAGCGTSFNFTIPAGGGTRVSSNLQPAVSCAYTVTETDTKGCTVDPWQGYRVVTPQPGETATATFTNTCP